MHPRVVISVGNFFFAIFSTITVYVVFPYLVSFMSATAAGFVIAGGSLVACALFPFLPDLVTRYGAQQLAIMFALAEAVALLALAAVPGAVAGAILIAVVMSLQPFLSYELDLLLEATVVEEGSTGRVRTLYLTAWNVAALSAPLLMGALLAGGDAYDRVFLAAAGALVPFVVLFAARRLPKVNPPRLARLGETFRCLMADRDLAAVTVNHLLLYLFFVWAPLYVPVFLHETLSIPWSELGWMFSVMLIPYLLIEYPAGWIADKLIGDKELMLAGFLLMGSSLAAVGAFTTATPLALIVFVLVISRAGAALVESMTEGHFFRRVSEKDVNSISIFRGIWPLADLIAPLVGSAILIFGNYELLFIITGGVVTLAGVVTTLFIKDFQPKKKTDTTAETAASGTTY